MTEARRNPPNRESPYCLLLEGTSDQHAVIHLMKRLDYDWDNASFERPFIVAYGGLAKLQKAITANKTKRRLGIVVDADEYPDRRWRELCKWLGPIVTEVPNQPDPQGLILSGIEPSCQVGIWMMPNNQAQGALEDLVKELVPPTDQCWELAREQAQAAKRLYNRGSQPFGFDLKSQLHTWLAWQEEPGMSFGQALNKRLLVPNSQTALAFKDWFLKLFPM